MSIELLFLSTQFFVILLLASVLAFVIGWLMRGKRPVASAPAVTLAEADPREQELAQLQRQQQELEQQCRQALELRDAAEQDAATQRRQLHEAEARLSSQQADLTTAQEQIQSLAKIQTEQNRQQQESAEALQQQLNESTARVQTAEAAAASALAQYAELESTLAALKTEAQQQKSLAQSAEQKTQQAQQANAQAEQKQHQLRDELQQAQQQAKHWQSEHAESQRKLLDLETQLQRLHAAQTAVQTPVKASPFKKFTLVRQADETPPQAAKAAHEQAQQQLQALEQEYQQRLDTVNHLDTQTPVPKVELATARSLLRDTQKRLADARALEERSLRLHAALERTFANLPEVEPDDLTRIKGVKAVLSSKLNEYGIYTYQQISALSPEDRLAYGDLLGFGNRIDREDWVGQAQRLSRAD
jgi:predicted flap endonuclease-1-like 5' DNA nuclease